MSPVVPATRSGPASACPAERGLAASCPSCGTDNPPGAKFCIECGTGLGGTGTTTAVPPATKGAPATPVRPDLAPPGAGAACRRSAARRPSLFADLSGYTAVAERMDPETVKSIVDRALRRLGQEVVRYGGRVDKYIGDNVMAVFGAPVAHEDDPERAVRAGLAMQARDGGDQRRHRRSPPTPASCCGSASTPARCSPARSATTTP